MMRPLKIITAAAFIAAFVSAACFAYTDKVEIINMTGDVSILPSGKTGWLNAGIGMVLRKGDRVKTGAGSLCNIAFDKDKDNVVGILENSDVIILLGASQKIELIDASIFARLKAIPKGTTFEIKAPTGVCGARGTELGADGDSKSLTATAYKDDIFVKNNQGEEKDVREGNKREIGDDGSISDESPADTKDSGDYSGWSGDLGNLISQDEKSNENKRNELIDSVEKMVDKTNDISERDDEKNLDAREETRESIQEEPYDPGEYEQGE